LDNILQLDAWLLSLILYVIMLFFWWIGFIKFSSKHIPGESTRIEDAGLALFGLLLAFCFAGAAGRYETRKALLKEDAFAISGFATVASVLKEPINSQINNELVAYVKQRMEFGITRLDDVKMEQILNNGREIQNRILGLVKKAIVENNTPTVDVALLNGYGALTQAHDERYYGIQNQVPGSIILMLVIFAMNAAFTMGRFTTPGSNMSSSAIRIGVYILLVVLVFDVTIDLEQPRRGVMRVSQAPMQDLLNSLNAH
jgi:hypothetical protein